MKTDKKMLYVRSEPPWRLSCSTPLAAPVDVACTCERSLTATGSLANGLFEGAPRATLADCGHGSHDRTTTTTVG